MSALRTHIELLPTELKLKTFAYLPRPELEACAGVSRQWSAVATELMQREYSFESTNQAPLQFNQILAKLGDNRSRMRFCHTQILSFSGSPMQRCWPPFDANQLIQLLRPPENFPYLKELHLVSLDLLYTTYLPINSRMARPGLTVVVGKGMRCKSTSKILCCFSELFAIDALDIDQEVEGETGRPKHQGRIRLRKVSLTSKWSEFFREYVLAKGQESILGSVHWKCQYNDDGSKMEAFLVETGPQVRDVLLEFPLSAQAYEKAQHDSGCEFYCRSSQSIPMILMN